MYTRTAAGLALLSALALPAPAAAQKIGIGPRMSFVQSGLIEGAPRDRYTGGTLRMWISARTAIEAAADWKSTTSEDATVRIRDVPMQGSLLVYPVRASLSPYLLGGVGWYSQTTQAMAAGEVLSEQTVRRFGYHGGFGGELRLGRRATVFADYRYRFIRFGEDEVPDGENGAGALGIPGVGSLFDAFRMSHEGSMWTGGLTINF